MPQIAAHRVSEAKHDRFRPPNIVSGVATACERRASGVERRASGGGEEGVEGKGVTGRGFGTSRERELQAGNSRPTSSNFRVREILRLRK